MRSVSRPVLMLVWTLLIAPLGFGADAAGGDHAGHAMAGSAAPALAIGAAVAPDGALWIAGVDAGGRLFVQSTRDDGANWSAPRRLDTAGDVVAAEGESRPSLAFGPRGQVALTYTQPLSKPYTGNIRLLRSSDDGKTFSAPVTVHDDRQEITHRFASLRYEPKGDLVIVWVDKRDVSKGADYAGAAIYGKVFGANGKPAQDLKLADHSCECCRIALAETPRTGVVALWRHVFAGNERDHAFAPLSALGSGAAPTRTTNDRWVLAACPHHGPGLTPAADRGFHAVWYDLVGKESGARYGRLDDAGHLLGAARPLPDPGAEHADVAAAGRRVAVVWRSFDGERTRLRAWVSEDDGAHFAQRDLAATASDNDHPRIVRNGAALQVVWRTADGVQVHRIDAPVTAWQPFDGRTWKSLLDGARPAAVVFTTTDCEYCPAVIEQLRRVIDALPAPRPALHVVVTDTANIAAAPAASVPYRLADVRHVFAGNELAVRHAVDPRWRGETPYVALLPATGEPVMTLGPPGPEALVTLGRAAKAPAAR